MMYVCSIDSLFDVINISQSSFEVDLGHISCLLRRGILFTYILSLNLSFKFSSQYTDMNIDNK